MSRQYQKMHQSKVPQKQQEHVFSQLNQPEETDPTSVPSYYPMPASGGHDFSSISISYQDTQPSFSPSQRLNSDYETIYQQIPFSATIRKVDMEQSTGQSFAEKLGEIADIPPVQRDAEPGMETSDNGPSPADLAYQPASNLTEPEEGQTVALPDITFPNLENISQSDSIGSTLAYNGSIAQTGAEPTAEFGATVPYGISMTGITATHSSTNYQVNATITHAITFQVRNTTGPGGQVSVEGPDSHNIDSSNYTAVVSDLTPNMGDLGGRPPRKNFWARDLTIIHERFHADETQKYGAQGGGLAQNWLNIQTASSVADVNTLVGQVPGRVIGTISTAMAFPGREVRAYADGAPLYSDRALAIKTKGDAGLYP